MLRILGLALLLSACQGELEAPAPPSPAKIEASADSRPEALPAVPQNEDWPGIYQRLVPCADCEGMAILLRLHEDRRYVLRTRRLPDESQDQKFEGEFQWLDGETLQLQGRTSLIFRFAGDRLWPLNGDREALPEDYALLRTE